MMRYGPSLLPLLLNKERNAVLQFYMYTEEIGGGRKKNHSFASFAHIVKTCSMKLYFSISQNSEYLC